MRRSLQLDPNFAPGHYGYALALQWDIWHFSERPFSEVQGTARAEARIAVSLDDKDAMAHAVLAHRRHRSRNLAQPRMSSSRSADRGGGE